MAQTFVQGAHNEIGTAVASLARAFSSNNAANNLLVYTVLWDSAVATVTMSDSIGNTIVDSGNGILLSTLGAYNVQTFCVLAAKAGANTVTASWGTNPAFSSIAIHEFNDSVNTGGWTIDKIKSAIGTSTNPTTGATLTTTQATETVFGWCGDDNGTISVGTGYTAGQDNQPTIASFSEYKFVTSTGTQTVAFVNAQSANWAAQCTTFFGVAGGAATAPFVNETGRKGVYDILAGPVFQPTFNLNLFKNPYPFNQYNYPESVRVPKAPFDLSVQINLNLFKNPIPFNQFDWSVTERIPHAPFDLSIQTNINLFKNPYPFNQYDWPEPIRIRKTPFDLSVLTNPNLFKNPIPISNTQGITTSWGVADLPVPQQPYNQSLYAVTVTVTLMGQVWT